MEATSYSEEDEVEADHWWFRGRRKLFASILGRFGAVPNSRILDAGTSSGTNLRMLRDGGFTDFRGLEISPVAIEICARKGLGPVERGDICNMPFSPESFDFVLATDIIEHVDRDDLALKEIHRVLKPGAHCLVTVPAFQSLWGHQDIKSHHKRRYRQKPLLETIRAAGLTPVISYHFNYLLFPPIWLIRRLMNFIAHPTRAEAQMNSPQLNRLLYAIFRLDTLTAPLLHPPFGVSILVVCRRPEASRA
jgi:SAM-dependent methyltransferase